MATGSGSGPFPARLAMIALLAVGGGVAHGGETEIVFDRHALREMGIRTVGRNTRGLTFEHTARRDAAGTPDLLNIETMTVVGGVIFVEQARPDTAQHACPAAGMDTSVASGRRLRVDFGQRSVAATLYDWELVPLAEFVQSGSDALFTYMGVHGQYHEAFADNLAGFNLFVLDTFRSLAAPSRAHLLVTTTVPGYTESRSVTKADDKAARKLVRWMRSSHLMFTDFDVDFVFRPEADALVIDGEPYWIAVSGRGAAASIDRRFDDAPATLAANPAVFGSAFRLAKHAAFFRYLQAECGTQWQALQASIAEARPALDLYTVRTRRMPYAVRR